MSRGGEEDMTEWLDELVRISGESHDSVMILEEPPGKPDDVMEIFSPPRVVTVARKRGLTGKWSVDKLVTRPDGQAWNLYDRKHQKEVLEIIEEEKPGLVIGSPPCSWYSRIMNLNWGRTPRWRRRQMMHEARSYFNFAIKA